MHTVTPAFALRLSFKLLAVAPQFYLHAANNASQAYVKQKLFKFKQAVMVLSKQPALFEGRFDKNLAAGSAPLAARNADHLLISLTMVVILERNHS